MRTSFRGTDPGFTLVRTLFVISIISVLYAAMAVYVYRLNETSLDYYDSLKTEIDSRNSAIRKEYEYD